MAITIRINGIDRQVVEGITLEALLSDLAIGLKGVAVELNREVIPKGRLGSVVVKDADAIEIIQMVGGG